jgi:hypothetical protein
LKAPLLIEAGLFVCPTAKVIGAVQEDTMAKGQKRSNREIRKPKKKPEPVVVAAGLTKGLLQPMGSQKKRG